MEMDNLSDIISTFTGGLRLTVRAKPGISRARDVKVVDIGDGKRAIEVAVSAEAKEGKANQAIIERLAKELGISKKQIDIKSGETGRLKIICIYGEPDSLRQKIIDIAAPKQNRLPL